MPQISHSLFFCSETFSLEIYKKEKQPTPTRTKMLRQSYDEQKRVQDNDRRFLIRLRENEVLAQKLALAEQDRELERQEDELALVRLRNMAYVPAFNATPVDVDEDAEYDYEDEDIDHSAFRAPSPVPSEPDYVGDDDDKDEGTGSGSAGVPFTSLFPPRSPSSPSEELKLEPPRYSSMNLSWQWQCPACHAQLGEFGNVAGNYVCNCDNPTQLCGCGSLGAVGAQCSCMNPFQ